ncbi:VOC family protein [Brevibacterium sp. GP-SGM9]|uniref:VOC family protein n=1 Tax=unclassified Brevibacterium TaxID=2614124 RepID=UPI001E3F0E63|nr:MULTISPECIES: VOC family protein [unclassified Brevibacterium]MCD1286026.1 glyoxalase [Brevibacterium sp. CCUG 69071]MDK8433378.1 VOC family protein [Brevibacterium sp. H-BE7]
MSDYPELLHTVIDTTDPRTLAEFYRHLLGYVYRPGDEPPETVEVDGESGSRAADSVADDADWLVLTDGNGVRKLAVQKVAELTPTTWPDDKVPMQLHLDFTVSDAEELERQRRRAVVLGATVLFDRTDDPVEPLYVFSDPSGHPFCIFVA